MKRFMRTIVPTSEYEAVKKVGDVYIVHLEPEQNENDGTACWETIESETPNMETLNTQLQEYKTYLAGRELAQAKQRKVKELLAYDSSSAINSFEIKKNGIKVTDYWLDRDLRTSLEGDVLAASSVGDTYKFDIRELGISLILNCNKFLEGLARLRQYAYGAYNKTSEHMAAINECSTLSEVNEYDFTTGYPQKLSFNVEDLT